MRAIRRNEVTIRLSDAERFQFHTNTGTIWVDELTFTGSGLRRDLIDVSGPAIKKDGSESANRRKGHMDLEAIPAAILNMAYDTLRAEVVL